MKQQYTPPVFEFIKFEYTDQVVASSGCGQMKYQDNTSNPEGCTPHGYGSSAW